MHRTAADSPLLPAFDPFSAPVSESTYLFHSSSWVKKATQLRTKALKTRVAALVVKQDSSQYPCPARLQRPRCPPAGARLVIQSPGLFHWQRQRYGRARKHLQRRRGRLAGARYFAHVRHARIECSQHGRHGWLRRAHHVRVRPAGRA